MFRRGKLIIIIIDGSGDWGVGGANTAQNFCRKGGSRRRGSACDVGRGVGPTPAFPLSAG